MSKNNNKNKQLLKGTVTYAIGDFGTKILSFLIVPLYTYYINTHDMGVYDLLISISSLLLPIVTLQISDAAYKWMISKQKDPGTCIEVSYAVIFINCIVCALTILIVNKFYHIPYYSYFIVLIIAMSWYTTIIKLIRGLSRQKLYALLGLLYTSINISLNFIQIVFLKRDIASLFISAIIACGICIIVSLVVEPSLRRGINFNSNIISASKVFISFSAPLIPNYLNWWLINSSDSFIVTYFLGASANGILAISHKFPAVLQTIFGLFNTAWQDISISDDKRDDAYYSEVFNNISKLMLCLLLFLIPLTHIFIFLIMDDSYKSSANYIPFYYLGAVFQGFSSFYGVGYLKNNKTSRAFYTSIYAAVINLIVDLLTIKFIGIHAASLSTLVGFFIMWLIREKQNREELGIIVNWKFVISLTIINVIIALVSIRVTFIVNFMMTMIGFVIFWKLNEYEIKNLFGLLIKKVLKNLS